MTAALITFGGLLLAYAGVLWITRAVEAKDILDWWDEGQGR